MLVIEVGQGPGLLGVGGAVNLGPDYLLPSKLSNCFSSPLMLLLNKLERLYLRQVFAALSNI
jgi:hypothetical protein